MRTKDGRRARARILELAILIALPVLFHYLIPVMTVIPRPYSYLGVVVMLIGVSLLIRSAMLFRKVGTSFQLQGGGTVLVTSGPFRWSRNPMYLGMIIWTIGLAILLGSLIAFLFPLLLFLLANFLMIPLEEAELDQIYKEEYIEYKRLVRRWL